MFHIGQMVVCVDDSWEGVFDHAPVKGLVYTIRAVMLSQFGTGGTYLLLEEIVNPPREYRGIVAEPRFNVEGFRPVRTTSIDCFTALLAPHDKRVEA